MLDVFNTIHANDIATLEKEFPDFYHNDTTPIVSLHVKSRLVEILQKCAIAQNKQCCDFILTFFSDLEKDGAPLLWAVAHDPSITHLLQTSIDLKNAQYALSVAIEAIISEEKRYALIRYVSGMDNLETEHRKI